jgi:hypothetical protein
MFSILDLVWTREALDPVKKLTDWELFQSLNSELISSDTQVHSSNEADKAARYFAASRALTYRVATRKGIILERKYEIFGLDCLLKHKRKLRNLWQETRDAACKTAVNWVIRNIRRRSRTEQLKNGKQSWQTVKSHLKQYGLLQSPSQKGWTKGNILIS